MDAVTWCMKLNTQFPKMPKNEHVSNLHSSFLLIFAGFQLKNIFCAQIASVEYKVKYYVSRIYCKLQ